jgi:hypothetical protein
VRTFACGGAGFAANSGSTAVLTNSVFSDSGIGVDAEGASAVQVNNSVVSGNGTGFFVAAGSTLRVSNSDVAFNGALASGTVSSFGNNRLTANGAGGAITPVGAVSNENGQQ